MGTDRSADRRDAARFAPIRWLEGVLPEAYHGPVGAALVTSLGLLSVVFHSWGIRASSDVFVAQLFGIVLPIVLAVLLIVTGVSLPRTRYGGLALRIGIWCLVGAGLLAVISVSTAQYQAALGVEFARVELVIGGRATAGGVVGLLIGIHDAERRLSQRRIAAEHERTERLSRRLSVLNRVLRHDIRNDVNVIAGNADRILAGEPVTDPATVINKKASKLLRMSENARRIEALLDQDDFPTEPIDVVALVEAKADEISAEVDRVELETVAPAAAWATANPMLESAVEHVLENAIQHNDTEVPEIVVTIRKDATTVSIEIADDGPGLPESEIAVLERGHETDLDHGSGLGLWITNWVVTESGGSLEFDHNEPRGSVVTIALPRGEPDT